MPTGRSRWAAISATDCVRWHSPTIARCSGPSPTSGGDVRPGRRDQGDQVEVPVTGRARPRVTAYGRTTGPAWSSTHWSLRIPLARVIAGYFSPAGCSVAGTATRRTCPTRVTSIAIS